jgi:hypothetical protein
MAVSAVDGSRLYPLSLALGYIRCGWLMAVSAVDGSWLYPLWMAHGCICYGRLTAVSAVDGSWLYPLWMAHSFIRCEWLDAVSASIDTTGPRSKLLRRPVNISRVIPGIQELGVYS